MKKPVLALIAVTVLAITAGIGYYQGSKSCSIQAHKEIDNTDKNVVTIIKEVSRPDGTKTVDTIITDRSKERKEIETIVKSAPISANRLTISALTSNFREVEQYQLSYERRIAGPLWLGVSANTKQQIGVGISYEF